MLRSRDRSDRDHQCELQHRSQSHPVPVALSLVDADQGHVHRTGLDSCNLWWSWTFTTVDIQHIFEGAGLESCISQRRHHGHSPVRSVLLGLLLECFWIILLCVSGVVGHPHDLYRFSTPFAMD